MTNKDLQKLLSALRLYRGPIDGILGPQSQEAVRLILTNANTAFLRWPEKKRHIAAAQIALDLLGHEPGRVDGLMGYNTREALNDFSAAGSKTSNAVPRVATEVHPTSARWPRQSDLESFYGPAGGLQCTAGSVRLPLPFPLAWDMDHKVTRIKCHEKIAGDLQTIFEEAVAHYGPTKFEALKLNVYGGCYNYRKMRGGTKLSTHAYGIAVDLDPEHNQLRWGRDKARFAKPEYDAFWKIVEAHGAVSLGRAANMDWMHFQFARL